MTGPPVIAELGCPACRRSFTVHLFCRDFPGEPHQPGKCPWCGHDGTAPTGTTKTAATFAKLTPFGGPSGVELAMSSACVRCGTFLFDREPRCRRCGLASTPRIAALEPERAAWRRRLRDVNRVKISYDSDDGSLTIDGHGNAELRELAHALYSRGQVYREAPKEIRIWRRSVRDMVGPVMTVLARECIPSPPYDMNPTEGSFTPCAALEHPDGRLIVQFSSLVTLASPGLAQVAGSLAALCKQMRASPHAAAVPNPERTSATAGRPRPIEGPLQGPPPPPPPRPAEALPARPPPRAQPAHGIPDDECAACETRSPFAERVEARGADLYTMHRCPSCREDFAVFRPALRAVVAAWMRTQAGARPATPEASPASRTTPADEALELALAEVLRDPRSDAPRMRYGKLVVPFDPDRATFIEAQLAAARLRRLGRAKDALEHDVTSYSLLAKEGKLKAWCGGVDALSSNAHAPLNFRRGFIEGLALTAPQFVTQAASFYLLAPIIDVEITSLGTTGAAALVASPQLKQLRSLRLYNTQFTDEDVRHLAASPYLERLAYLDLGFNQLTDAGLEALCAANNLPGLRYLRLTDNPCGDVNPRFDEQDGRRYGLVPSALADDLRKRFGDLAWLASAYTSAEPPPVDAFP